MKKLNLLILALPIFLLSCGGDPADTIVPDEPVGSSTTVITGAISATLEYEAEFLHSITTVDAGFSGLTLGFGNIGQTESAVIITLLEFGNNQGFSMGTYNFNNDPNAQLILTSLYIDDVNSYTINPTDNITNKLILTKIEDNKLTGTFEFNLESPDGDKIKLTGSFEAIGETLKL
jgi:hypothetical protein